jgi:WD repeat-containing protein 19
MAVKNFAKVGELLPNLESTKIYFQYAKAKEAEGNYEEAVKGYEKAKDYENLVRLLVEHLRKINEVIYRRN